MRRPDGTLRAHETVARLRQLLVEARIDLASPTNADIDAALTACKELAAHPVVDAGPPEEGGDLLLAQFGTYDWGEGEHFEVDLTRQFAFFDDEGEYSHMTHLSCTFEFEVTEEFRGLGSGDLWSTGLTVDEFFEQARQLPGFVSIRRSGAVPSRLRVEYQEV